MMHSDFEFLVENRFDHMCRLIMKNEKKIYFKHLSNLSKREITFSDIGDHLISQSPVLDKYIVDAHFFSCVNLNIEIENEILVQAFEKLSNRNVKIMIYYYFLGFNDSEIAHLINLNRSTVTRQRNKSLIFIKQSMEDQCNET